VFFQQIGPKGLFSVPQAYGTDAKGNKEGKRRESLSLCVLVSRLGQVQIDNFLVVSLYNYLP
jgi:hypothetical protein